MAFYLEDVGQILVDVHQVVRDLTGAVVADEHVGHRFTFDDRGLIQIMEVFSFTVWLTSGQMAPLSAWPQSFYAACPSYSALLP